MNKKNENRLKFYLNPGYSFRREGSKTVHHIWIFQCIHQAWRNRLSPYLPYKDAPNFYFQSFHFLFLLYFCCMTVITVSQSSSWVISYGIKIYLHHLMNDLYLNYLKTISKKEKEKITLIKLKFRKYKPYLNIDAISTFFLFILYRQKQFKD